MGAGGSAAGAGTAEEEPTGPVGVDDIPGGVVLELIGRCASSSSASPGLTSWVRIACSRSRR